MHVCIACSYFKRILDTMSRFRYIQYAYKNMATWMACGEEPVIRLKRYIHRHLDLPPTLDNIDPEDAEDYLIQFGFQYVDSLLTYCSDDLKPGMFLVN